ncbi:SDR family oxidoreductase [Sphingomonas corticis]|uniref:SDR family NAD(P)-dependent oxidoreductase n=1 Tax=Sphingomonas corticis TaxID=2722791 RepID=A0ABX1CKR3_9SPHN|nr:SDR family NAD(P)-dependent oxidoreductase [Sphingomonas corticis]NJR78576.1 SDR family NAD(P)-dependent oxidoreductase [Sphingomonas corticis]
MTDHLAGKTIVVTGGGGGFGRLVSQKAAARGALVTCGDVDAAAAQATADLIAAAGGRAQALGADVTRPDQVAALVRASVDRHGGIDVMVNNAGIMPLGFFADHEKGHAAWLRCIDINVKGVLNGMVAAYDPMMAAGRGQIVNISSIYGNFPVIGAAAYGASKAAVNFLSESFRIETRGRIKVTTVKPTGVPATGLSGSIVNRAAVVGILGHNMAAYGEMAAMMADGSLPPERLDAARMDYQSLAPDHIADAVIHAIDQPWGVSIAEVTVRAAGDHFIL